MRYALICVCTVRFSLSVTPQNFLPTLYDMDSGKKIYRPKVMKKSEKRRLRFRKKANEREREREERDGYTDRQIDRQRCAD